MEYFLKVIFCVFPAFALGVFCLLGKTSIWKMKENVEKKHNIVILRGESEGCYYNYMRIALGLFLIYLAIVMVIPENIWGSS